jgi:transcription elongation factor Elf1
MNRRKPEMSSNYPEGSMMGSGIYSQSWTGTIHCPTCEEDVEVEGQTDDWGNRVFADCPKCEEDLEKDITPDWEDEKYDAWKDR